MDSDVKNISLSRSTWIRFDTPVVLVLILLPADPEVASTATPVVATAQDPAAVVAVVESTKIAPLEPTKAT
jgi:hypothetical protein